MTGRLQGKVAVVTGGGSGIGRAGAAAMAAESAAVVVADLDPERACSVANAISADGAVAEPATLDVTDAGQVRTLMDSVARRHGAIDVLFHTAVDVAFVNERDDRLIELDDDVWDRMLRLVLTGTYLCAKHAGRHMVDRGSGSIVLTGTTDALIGCARLDAYTAAKGGVLAVTRSFAAGVAKDGVRVNAICPSFVSSEPQLGWLAQPESRRAIDALHLLPVPSPDQIAPLVVYLASDESATVTGTTIPIDSGYMAFKADLDVVGGMRPTERS